MTLFEIRTGWMGESYQRAYAWAESEEQARKLFAQRSPERPAREVLALFTADDKPFCTQLSDAGWER